MKTLKLFLSAAIVMSLAACGNGGKSASTSESNSFDTIVTTTESSDFNSDVSSESADAEYAVESAESPESDIESADVQESAGSEDWDALLRSYEQYVDKYIAYMKKAAKGDMSALSEYPALLEKAQDLDEKLKNAEGEMSASQWKKYGKISMKMFKAAGEMR
jgi:hypothetical protein